MPVELLERLEQRALQGALDAHIARLRVGHEGNISSIETQALIIELQELVEGARCLEIGTYFARTTRVMAETAARTGGRVITIDPFGGHRIPQIIREWPEPLREVTEFHDKNSMSYFMMLDDQGTPKGEEAPFDIVFVDGNHAFEYALFDLLSAACFLKPGGAMVIDNIDQRGPYLAARQFLERYRLWRPFEFGPGRKHLEAMSGANAAIIFSPAGIEIGEQPYRLNVRGLDTTIIRELHLPIAPATGTGTLTSSNNLCFFADDDHISGAGPITKVAVRETRVSPGADVVRITFDEPLAIYPPNRPGQIRLELEFTYAAASGTNLLLDTKRDIDLF